MLFQIKPQIGAPLSPSSQKTSASSDDLIETDFNSGLSEDMVLVPLTFGFFNENSGRMEHPTFVRILFLNRKMTTSEIYFEVFDYLSEYIKRIPNEPITNNKEKNISSRTLFERMFPKEEVTEKTFSPYFQLNIVNNSASNTCFQCLKKNCTNCLLVYSSKVTLHDLLNKYGTEQHIPNIYFYNPTHPKSTKEKVFELELVWSKSAKEKIIDSVNKYDEPNPTSPVVMKNGIKHELNLYNCFDQFVENDILDEENKWFCSRCKDHVQATKAMKIYKAPMILIIALKRFKSFSHGMKNGELVDFPIKGLDIEKYVEIPCNNEKSSTKTKTCYKYDLFAVSNHFGSLAGGHYTAFALNSEFNKWFCFDDSSVSPAKDIDIVSSAAYVLFYRRQDLASGTINFNEIHQKSKCETASN